MSYFSQLKQWWSVFVKKHIVDKCPDNIDL
jgi:hypothetical protein